jgi:hypothetical protein
MADPKAESKSATKLVRALQDHPGLEGSFAAFQCGKLAEVPTELVAGLKADGMIDDHPEAVAYAKKLKAKDDAAAAEAANKAD